MATKVEFKRVQTDAEVENIDIKDGQLIYTGTGKTFMDYGNQRIPTGSGAEPVEVDTEMSDTSTNAVQNKVIKEYVDDQIDSVPEEVAISNIEPIDPNVKLWINDGGIESVTEIVDHYSRETKKGYSCDYVNNLTQKNIITVQQTTETIYTTDTNYRVRFVPMNGIISQIGDGLELTNDGGVKIKGNFKYVKVSLSIGLGSTNAVNSYGLGLGKSMYNNMYVGQGFYSIVDNYNHANTFKLLSSNELLVSVNQNDVIYSGVYVFNQGNVQVRSAYLTVEVVE